VTAIISSGDVLTGYADSEVLAGVVSGTANDTITANGGHGLGGAAAVQFASLSTELAMTASDFFVI